MEVFISFFKILKSRLDNKGMHGVHFIDKTFYIPNSNNGWGGKTDVEKLLNTKFYKGYTINLCSDRELISRNNLNPQMLIAILEEFYYWFNLIYEVEMTSRVNDAKVKYFMELCEKTIKSISRSYQHELLSLICNKLSSHSVNNESEASDFQLI